MALVSDVELDNGLVIDNAYLRIVSFNGTESNVNFIMNIYVNKDAYVDGKTPITSKTFDTTFNKDRNLFSQMYEHLLSLPEYETAVEA